MAKRPRLEEDDDLHDPSKMLKLYDVRLRSSTLVIADLKAMMVHIKSKGKRFLRDGLPEHYEGLLHRATDASALNCALLVKQNSMSSRKRFFLPVDNQQDAFSFLLRDDLETAQLVSKQWRDVVEVGTFALRVLDASIKTRDNAWALCGRGPWPLLPVGDAVLLHLKQNSTTSTRERWFKFDVNGHPGCGDALRNALIRKLSVQSDGNDIDRQCAMAAMRHLRCPFGVYEQICRRSETTWGDIHLSAIVDCGVKRFLYHTSEEDLLELAEAGEFRSPFVRRLEGILFVVDYLRDTSLRLVETLDVITELYDWSMNELLDRLKKKFKVSVESDVSGQIDEKFLDYVHANHFRQWTVYTAESAKSQRVVTMLHSNLSNCVGTERNYCRLMPFKVKVTEVEGLKRIAY